VCESNAPATPEVPPAGFEDHQEYSEWLGCDLRARQQNIAMLDTETGEFAAKSRHFVRKAPCRILSWPEP
jgi:hypothetical protein